MFRVFDDDEISLWAAYTQSLATTPALRAPAEVPPTEAAAMAALIDELETGAAGHTGPRHQHARRPPRGGAYDQVVVRPNPPSDLMQALSSPVNDVITPGKPEHS